MLGDWYKEHILQSSLISSETLQRKFQQTWNLCFSHHFVLYCCVLELQLLMRAIVKTSSSRSAAGSLANKKCGVRLVASYVMTAVFPDTSRFDQNGTRTSCFWARPAGRGVWKWWSGILGWHFYWLLFSDASRFKGWNATSASCWAGCATSFWASRCVVQRKT